MKSTSSIVFLLFLRFLHPCPASGAEIQDTFGPRDEPHKFPAYGGTQDLSSPEDMGLDYEEVESLLQRIKSEKQQERARALSELLRDAVGSEKSLRKALWNRREATNTEMRKAILECRRKISGNNSESGLLKELIRQDPGNRETGAGIRGALAVLSLVEALHSLNTLAAYKIMIEFSPKHAGVFRKEIGRMLVARGLDALPSLIYSRSHENNEIRMFAVKWIRDMNKPLLSQQVKIKNPRRLAQLLEAYASINELKALEVTLSLTNHSSLFVRRSARMCMKSYGKNAKWPIRRLYENTFSEQPKDDDNIDAMLGELYEYFDAQRLKPQMAKYKEGEAAREEKNYSAMEEHYLAVLLKSPMFPEKSEMAKGFLEYGDWLRSQQKNKDAAEKYTMAERLAEPSSDIAHQARANLDWQQALELQQSGVVEPILYQRILDKNPHHPQAAKWYQKLTSQQLPLSRYLYKTFIVSLLIFLAGILIFKRLRS